MSALLSFNKKHQNKNKDTNLLFNNYFPTLKVMFLALGNMPQILKSTISQIQILFLPRSHITLAVSIFYTFQNENLTKAKITGICNYSLRILQKWNFVRVSLITLTLQHTECKPLFISVIEKKSFPCLLFLCYSNSLNEMTDSWLANGSPLFN